MNFLITRGAWQFNDLVSGVGSDARRLLEETEDRIRPDDPVNIQFTSVGLKL